MAEHLKKSAPSEETAEAKKPTEADEALDSFLSRESSEKKHAKPVNKRFNRSMIALLSAVIVVAVLTGVIITLNHQPYNESEEDLYVPARMIATVDEAGVHRVIIPTDADGDPVQNGSGSLIGYTPSLIDTIRVENASGSFTIRAHTHSGEATEYTLTGYERFALQAGVPDAVANDAAAMDFIIIAGTHKDPALFGLDAPRATVTVSFTDGTSAKLLVGSEAPASAGTYVAFGDTGVVYLVEDDAVDSFFYSPADFISLSITDSPETSDAAAFKRITLTGSHYPETIVLEPNTDSAVNYYYKMTAPVKLFADTVMSSDIAGSIRGLYAEKVAAVNAESSDAAAFLASYGLSGSGYAEVTAEYADATVRLRASAPDSEGYVYLVDLSDPSDGGSVVYQIQIGAVSWASASTAALTPDTILSVSRTAISNITLTAYGKTYSIDVDTKTQTVTDTDGTEEQITTTEAYYDDRLLDDDSFTILLQNLSGMPNKGAASASGGAVLLEIRYTYTTGRAADTLILIDTGEKNVAVTLNGSAVGTTPKSYASALIANLGDIDAGKLPESL